MNKNLDICRTCTRLGSPRTVQQAKKEYPCIVGVKTFDRRGGVSDSSIVVTICRSCRKRKETLFDNVRAAKGKWRCRVCAGVEQHGRKFLYPKDLPRYIKGVDRETLGGNKQVTAHTLVKMCCPDCKEARWVEWQNVERNKRFPCKSCATARRWKSDAYRIWYTQMMQDKWQDGKTRKAFLGNRQGNLRGSGSFSGLHRDVKASLVAAGIAGFESEKCVGDFRVDELNQKERIVLEVFGDFWHLNPVLYKGDYRVVVGKMEMAAKDRWKIDAERIKTLKSMGYRIYVIWERDFRQNGSLAIGKFKKWLKL